MIHNVDFDVVVKYDYPSKNICLKICPKGSTHSFIEIDLNRVIIDSINQIASEKRRIHTIEHEEFTNVSNQLDRISTTYKSILDKLWIRYYF